MNKMQHICVVGFNWSGSSAVVDLMKEFSGNWDPEDEFFILTLPNGIMDLENVLFERWDPHNVDIAIHDLLSFAMFINRNQGKFSRGMSYDDHFHGQFMQATKEFVEEITSYEFKGYWWIYNYKMPYSKWLYRKIKNKIIPKEYFETMYYSKPTREEFYKAVQNYMNKLVEAISIDQGCRNIILDQAVQPQHPAKAFDYFDNAKVIVVDRDPRDIYCELVELKKLIGRDIAETHDTWKFIKWHKDYRENGRVNDERILYLQFEDLIYSYDEAINKIVNFIDDPEMSHTDVKKYFDPAVSKKNVGKYKNFKYQDEIKQIEDELSEYLYVQR